jgi:hypothetical protein
MRFDPLQRLCLKSIGEIPAVPRFVFSRNRSVFL